jgi:hypothetical protein
MSFVPLPVGAKVTLDFLWAGVECHNTLFATTSAGPNPTNMAVLAASLNTWLLDLWAGNATAAAEATGVTITDMTSPSGPSLNFPLTVAAPGTAGTHSVPNNVTIATTFQTAHRGRSFRGRAYWVGLDNAMLVDSRTLLSANAAAFDTCWNDFQAAVNAAGYAWVVASFHAGGVPRVSGVATPVLAVRTGTTLDTQRRRISPSHV